nr:MAG TPA: hypothetical protein [Caudoviricetes sp.]
MLIHAAHHQLNVAIAGLKHQKRAHYLLPKVEMQASRAITNISFGVLFVIWYAVSTVVLLISLASALALLLTDTSSAIRFGMPASRASAAVWPSLPTASQSSPADAPNEAIANAATTINFFILNPLCLCNYIIAYDSIYVNRIMIK